jgi:hypothetical protein
MNLFFMDIQYLVKVEEKMDVSSNANFPQNVI